MDNFDGFVLYVMMMFVLQMDEILGVSKKVLGRLRCKRKVSNIYNFKNESLNKNKFNLYDTIRINKDIPELDLIKDSKGVIVHIYYDKQRNQEAFIIEVLNQDGSPTYKLPTLKESDIELF